MPAGSATPAGGASSRSANGSFSPASRGGGRSLSWSRSSGPRSTSSGSRTASASTLRRASAAGSSTPSRAVLDRGRPEPGDWIVVHGCGGVGLSAVMIAAAHGARVIAVDVSAAALELATSVGAAATINGAVGDVVAAVHDLTGGGAQVSLDALGSTRTCRDSIRSLRTRGRHVQVGLLVAEDDSPRIPMARVIARELEILGSHGMAAHAYPPMLGEILDGSLAPQRLIQHRLELAQAGTALAELDQRAGDGITMIYPLGF